MTTAIHPAQAEQNEPTVSTAPVSRRKAALARAQGLLSTLREIEADRQMADRFIDPGNWLAELASENRDIWDHLAEALAPVSSKNAQNTKEQTSDGD